MERSEMKIAAQSLQRRGQETLDAMNEFEALMKEGDNDGRADVIAALQPSGRGV